MFGTFAPGSPLCAALRFCRGDVTMAPKSTVILHSGSSRAITSPASASSTPSPATGQKRVGDHLDECPMLRKVPAIQKTGDEVEDLKREGQRDDPMELLQLIWRHPERINPALNFVRKLGRRTDDTWALHPPSLLSQVPKAEVVVFLADRGFNAEVIDGIMCTDDGFVINLFCLLLHAPPTLTIPKCLQENSSAFWRSAVRPRPKLQ